MFGLQQEMMIHKEEQERGRIWGAEGTWRMRQLKETIPREACTVDIPDKDFKADVLYTFKEHVQFYRHQSIIITK